MARGEFDRIASIVENLPDVGPEAAIGPGDDCAAYEGPDGRLTLITVDALVEERHFVRRDTTPAAVGRRLAAVNLSDIAAMGGTPRFAVLSLAIPEILAESWTERIAGGAAAELARFDARMIGGNLSGSAEHVFADLALIGDVERDRVLRRDGARAGDRLFVTGRLGAAAAGRYLAHDHSEDVPSDARAVLLQAWHHPQARIAEGRLLASTGGATACIDLSDGLHQDAGHIANASELDVELRADLLPIPDEVKEAAEAKDQDAIVWAAAWGEDYELLVALDPEQADEIAWRVHHETGTPMTEIGRVTTPKAEAPAVRWIDDRGNEVEGPEGGWDHFEPDESEA